MHICLARELVNQDGIRLEDAYRIVKKAFYHYMRQGMQKEYRKENRSFFSKVKEKLRSIEFLEKRVRPWWQNGLSYFNPERFQLPSLLKIRSPGYQDFIKIYKIVTDVRREQSS